MDNALVWVGTFDTPKDYKDYANHDRKKCPWRDDFPIGYEGATYFDTFKEPGETLRHAMLRLFYSAGYLEQVEATLEKLNLEDEVNAVKVVLVPKKGMKEVDTANWGDGLPMRYLGNFEFSGKTPLTHPEHKSEPQFSQKGFVSVWIGDVKSVEKADEYMEEDDDIEDGPMSAFGKDWKLSYDHDFLFHEASEKPLSVAKLLEGWNGAEQFAKPAAKAAKAAGIEKGNFVVVAYDLDYSVKPPFSTSDPAGYWRHKGKPRAKSPLTFVGSFRIEEA